MQGHHGATWKWNQICCHNYMKMIQANCRVQFTANDVDFILAVLGRKKGDAPTLTSLLADTDTRDVILDDESLLHALLEQGGCLRVSAHLYFYVMVRHVLRRAGLDDRNVADYLAELLTEFSREDRAHCVINGVERRWNYFFEMVAALENVDDQTAFRLRAHIGNHSLLLSGVFSDHICYRASRRGAPGLRYYEELGRSNFRVASYHRLAASYDLAEVFDTLSERFQPARCALHELAERVFNLGDPEIPAIFRS
jgi:hypothetical protein